MKNISIGIEDFSTLITSGSEYVDKTKFIQEVIKLSPSTIALYTRPRRFGKSLMISTLYYFFDITKDSKDLFKGLAISKDKECFSKINSYPVLRLNMKSLIQTNFDDCLEKYRLLIQNVYQTTFTEDDIKNFDKNEQAYINKIISNQASKIELTLSIRYMTIYLRKKYNKKVILLIDEYDAPIQSGFDNDYYDEQINFYKDLYGEALKGNEENIEKGILTGVSEVAQASIFSGINNIKIPRLLNNNEEYFGFTLEEVKSLCLEHQIDFDQDKLQKWYGGYRFAKEDAFNPWSILNFIDQEGFYDYYWTNTTEGAALSQYIPYLDEETLNNLLNDEYVEVMVSKSINYKNINAFSDLSSLLIRSGYLSVIGKSKISENYQVGITNKEMKQAFRNAIYRYYHGDMTISIVNSLYQALINEDENKISDCISDYLLSTFSYYDLDDEKNYQIILLCLTSMFNNEFLVKSEVESGFGRCDILIKSKYDKKLGIIIECKHFNDERPSASRFESYARSAINQALTHKYKEALIEEDYKRIIIYGIAFNKKSAKAIKHVIR